MEIAADLIQCETDGAVARLTMNRPQARNSLSLAMLDQLSSKIHAMGNDSSVHVVVLAGNGPGFCAGHDLKEMTAARAAEDGGRAFFEKTMTACSRLMQAIVNCPKPVIAEVHGIATAAGCQLVASCDLAIASDAARFATPGVHIGLFCSTPMVALSRNVSRKAAMEMLLTGDMIDAETALQFGLVNRVVTPDDLTKTTMGLAKKVASKAPATLKIGKEAFYSQAELPLSDAYLYASGAMVMNMMEPDAQEGIGAFIEKREPKWAPL